MRYANKQEKQQAKDSNPVIYGERCAEIPTLEWKTEGPQKALVRRVQARLDEEAQKIALSNDQRYFDISPKKKCPRCNGSGHYYSKKNSDTVCFKCGGKGIVLKSGEVSNWQKNNGTLCLKEDSTGNWTPLFSEGFI